MKQTITQSGETSGKPKPQDQSTDPMMIDDQAHKIFEVLTLLLALVLLRPAAHASIRTHTHYPASGSPPVPRVAVIEEPPSGRGPEAIYMSSYN